MDFINYFNNCSSRNVYSGVEMDWLDKLLEMGVIGIDDYHREYGKVCGYPKCCIEFFIKLELITGRQALFADVVCGIDDLSISYVRCPKCREVTNDGNEWIFET